MTTCQQIRASTIDKLHYHRHPYQSPRSSMIGIADILNKDSPPNDQTLTLSNTIKECESLDNNSTCSNPQKDSPEISDRSISDEITTIEKTSLQALTSASDDITTHHLSIKSPTHVEIPPISSLTKLLSRQFNPPQAGSIKAPGQPSSNNHLAYLPTRRITSSHYGGFIDNALESRKARSNSLQLLSLSPSLQLSLSISSPLIDSSNLVSTAASPTRSPKSRQSSFVREPSLLTVEVKDVELSTSVKRLLSRKPRIPKSRIHKKILASKKFVQLSIRRKNGTSHSTGDPGDISKHIENSTMGGNQISNYDANAGSLGSKLHFKSLEAGMKVKLTLSNSFVSLYNHLIPGVNKRQIYKLVGQSKNEGISCTYVTVPAQSDSSVVSLPVQIIDSSLVNMADIPNKVLRSLANLPTFNSFNTAVNTLFGGVADYTLVRVTRSSATTNERSVLLKLETAKPGDFSLIDDDESAEEMLHSLGKTGDSPSNIFVKKIVARPRYKSKMKIYMIPVNQDCVLYTDERMFERDLYNGIVDLTDTNPDRKEIFVTFSVNHIIQEYNSLVKMSALESPLEQPVPGLPLPPQNFGEKHSWPMGYSTSTPGIINYTNYSSSTTSRISSKNSPGGSISS
ncbi:uncharacterized protein KQ657_000773 [Scheffersomyces spartinae]|uniref:Uncharacterized protein n=1 Tax=Scheffersomyces spartinae TaxID=45513 RepID=A0A9P7V8Q9_9ASCO|nr:uncharacterized protein KQ657_000773 [Scheffersomyces spartinae]KAG7193356.1 hypothetical protein KQ657_000773 [Scheffersomyces spartinae]